MHANHPHCAANAQGVVAAMEAYQFSDATQRLYAWWQYDLCDVFIELMKPIMADDPEVGLGCGVWVWGVGVGVGLGA